MLKLIIKKIFNITTPTGDLASKLDFIKRHEIFSNIPESKCLKIAELADFIKLSDKEYIARENNDPDNFYIVVNGQLSVLKENNRNKEFEISTINENDTVAETTLLDKNPHPASARSDGESVLLSIPIDKLESLAKKHPVLYDIYLKAAKFTGKSLRKNNESIIKSLERQLDLGTLLIYILPTICIFTFCLEHIEILNSVFPSTTVISATICIGLMSSLILMIRHIGISRNILGITTYNCKKSIIEGVLSGFFMLGVCVLIKWVIMSLIFRMPNYHLFGLHYNFSSIKSVSNINAWLFSLIIYVLFVPIQEFMVRSCLQAPLELFLPKPYASVKAIVLSSILFSTIHLAVSIKAALLSFIPTLFWGWLFFRHRNLIGVIVSHIILGVGVLFIVRVSGFC